jgi:ankyrin repeat protein
MTKPAAAAGAAAKIDNKKKQKKNAIKGKDPRALLATRITSGREQEIMSSLKATPELLNASLDADGCKALQIACRAGHPDVVQNLLKLGALLDATNDQVRNRKQALFP